MSVKRYRVHTTNTMPVAGQSVDVVLASDYEAVVKELRSVSYEGNKQFITWEECKAQLAAAQSRVAELEARNASLERELAALGHYAQHADHCGDRAAHYNAHHYCGCGLEAVRERIDAALAQGGRT